MDIKVSELKTLFYFVFLFFSSKLSTHNHFVSHDFTICQRFSTTNCALFNKTVMTLILYSYCWLHLFSTFALEATALSNSYIYSLSPPQKKKKYIYIEIEIEKVDVFRKVLNKQFIERLGAISIINKTQLQTPTDCFAPWGDHQGNLNQHNKTLKTIIKF